MELNFEKICRVCLTEGEIMMSLFKVNVSRKIMSCASVQVWPNDNLPHQICQKCCAKLHVAFQFKRLCEKSDSKLRTYILKSGKSKTKEKEHYQEQQNCLNKEDKLVKQHDELQQQIQHNALHIQQPQSNCLFVECNGDVIDVPIQDQSFIQSGQTVQQTISAPMNTYNNMSQAPIQIGNYNIQNVIYSTTYPVTLQTLQPPNNLVHSQVVTSIPLQTQSIHHTQQNIEQSTMDVSPLVKNNNIQTNLVSQKAKDEDKKQENPNQCSICLKIFPNSTKKNRHMKIHSKSDMPYKCSVCNKEFMHGGNYKIHMRMHNNEKPFSCTVCPKRFVQAQDLEKHMRTHTGERPHKCTMCWKAFSTGSN
ncbi:hypothetical protein WA026_017036 [Henosepilachna vigintioctopunctata]|uniref:Uncharacterized protein n=1 Tax=Henosepilachna vigintioctopunctata TaxID=420089 RepID=A0AAW1TLD9_9CUCU